MKEYAIGNELSADEAKDELKAGRILTTRDSGERAIFYRGKHYATWRTAGRLVNVLNYLVDFTGWFLMEREDERSKKETATTDNTDLRSLSKVFFR
jgi:hypothetical protein